MSDTILETRALCKDFSGFNVVSEVDLRVRRGDIHALIGPNGAGKTTLFHLLTRFLQPTSGTIVFDGQDITRLRAHEIASRGLIRSFQISATFGGFTAMENVRLALQRRHGPVHAFWRSSKVLRRFEDRAMELLALVGLTQDAQTLAAQLPYGKKRVLELATTFAMEPVIMLLDEPTQGMGHEDVGRITALIQRLAEGRTVLMVEHNMGVVSGICDRVTVLQRGRVLAEGSYELVSRDPRVMEAYMGVEA
jgi:branched-chain amino acid transport system ATP-binding protein